MSTPSIQTLITQAQQVLNLKSSNEIRATLAAILANANVGTPLNPNLTTQQLWDEFYEIVRQPSDDIMSIITDQMMRMVFSPPAPGGAGADKQVIFNDGGVLAGDTKFLWDKNANRLDVDGPVVITGDLTVRTNKLIVNTDGVGIGVTPTAGLSLTLNGELGMLANNLFYWNGYYNGGFKARAAGYSGNVYLNGTGDFLISNTPTSAAGAGSVASFYERYRINKNGEHTWEYVSNVAGTAMTLNSTGLGIGASPTTKLDVLGSGDGELRLRAGSDAALIFSETAANKNWKLKPSGGDFQFQYSATAYNSGYSPLMTLTATGNVGIGVAPSAWTSYKALQINTISSIAGSSGSTDVGMNWIYKSGDKYIGNGLASSYVQYNGSHIWNTAANNVLGAEAALTWTPAMTLDASGNLLVGTTSSASSSGSGFKVTSPVAGHFDPFVVTSANNINYSCWDIYSTGGTAGYRFYVTSTGTINAINPVIAAISDARLKENVQDLDVGLDAILALKPRKFDWKEGKGKNIKGDRGFIAQEFETVFPNLIDEWKDSAPEGEAPYKSVRQDLIPVLVKAIQELTARVQTLEAK